MADAPAAVPPPPRPLTGGVVMSGASRITVAATGALTTVFVARLLGPDGAGGFAIALTLVTLMQTVTTLGVEHGIVYYVSSGRWSPREALGAARRVALAVGVLGALGCLGARLALPSAFAGLSVGQTAVTVVALPFALGWFYSSYIGLAVDRYESFVLPPAVQSACTLGLVIVLASIGGLAGAVIALTASHVLAGATAAWLARGLPDRPGDGHHHQLRRAASFGIKGYAANALQFLNFRLDLFILSAAVGAAAVGQLSVAVAVTTVMWLLPQALSDVLFPRIAALSAVEGRDSEEVRAFVEAKSLRHAVLVIACGTVVLAGALVFLVVPIFTEEFRPAVELGLILLPGVALLGVAQILSATIVGRGKPIYSLYSALIVTPITVVLYLVLVPALGAEGAALVKSGSFALSFALGVFFYRRLTGSVALSLFVPTRDELRDLRALAPQIREWAAGVLRRRAARR